MDDDRGQSAANYFNYFNLDLFFSSSSLMECALLQQILVSEKVVPICSCPCVNANTLSYAQEGADCLKVIQMAVLSVAEEGHNVWFNSSCFCARLD